MSLKTKIFKFIGLSAFLGTSFVLWAPNNAKADHESGHLPTCPGTSSDLSSLVGNVNSTTGACYTTPSKYEITLYEMGFCTSDPMTGANLDKTDCVSTVDITAGKIMDLAPGNKATLPASSTRPPAGTYPYTYIVVGNTFELAGSYTSNNGNTYYSTPNADGDDWGDTITTGSSATEFTAVVTTFTGGTCDSQYDRTVTGKGVIKAYLADTSQQTTSTDDGSGNCTNAARIVGSFKPTNALVLTKTTNGLDVNFTVTDSGLQIETWSGVGTSNDSGTSCQNQPCTMYTGDFQPVFTTF